MFGLEGLAMLLQDAFELFARGNRTIRNEHTKKLYHLAIRQFSEAVGHPATIDDLVDENIVALEKVLEGRSPFTVNERTGRIKAIWRWAAKKGYVRWWPTIAPMPEPDISRRAWHIDQLRAIMTACSKMRGVYHGVQASDWWLAWHSFQFDCGERTGCMLKLRWEWLSPRGIDIPGEARKCNKSAFYRLSERTLDRLNAIRSPSRDLIFHWPASVSCFYLHYGRLLTLAGLPSDRRSKPQRVRRSHLTYWHIAGEDATARAKHSSPDVTAKHYLDESLMPQIDPASVLPTL